MVRFCRSIVHTCLCMIAGVAVVSGFNAPLSAGTMFARKFPSQTTNPVGLQGRSSVGIAASSFLPQQSTRVSLRQATKSAGLGDWKMAAGDVDGVAVILLAGGVGSRMKADRPKQFLELNGKPILHHSLELFLGLKGVSSISVVIAEQYRDDLSGVIKGVKFAEPGKERQDSVFNGLQTIPEDASLVCVHDAARPLVTPEEIYNVFDDATEHGAAVLAVPMKATVKESADGQFVLQTIDRSRLWEIHTPQVMKPQLLIDGFEKVEKESLAVTDDVSIVEQLPAPVKITVGEYTNIKITTPEDMPMAESILLRRAETASV